ncbi:glycosyltransferase family 4 protein [Gloeocapsopsis crepidinum LEGE 06123]|uniref:Glycosyltransferase family 4 protein n=1 Tax=Gloeocapsopsis crepidinum LEGE 06123 TaxID=588587 RepID=A0ABR9UQF4_9CHRO|nr:glycosyltransferase family 4 protein [Gloeocapsopsis crepidinum]MBE9190512.1 glycosyltransferase family 4 protein [Gloeocapsopsis crepidinum LEGE 06123]
MKVLHLWTSDSGKLGGGGAVSMHRLHMGLRSAGVDSQILCENKTTDSPYVQVLEHWSRWETAGTYLKKFTSRLGLNDIHRVSSFKIKQHQAYIDTEILHFHGTHSGFINYLALPYLTQNKPAVFTLCDMWAFTGHCAFSYDCDRWKTGCGHCPYPESNPYIRRDGTRIEWKLKEWIYNRSNITFVTKSKWLTEVAQQSILNRHPIYEIPNGIDTEIYQPLDREQCRAQLGIPQDKNVLMFAAVRLDHFQKGGDLLLKALQTLPASLKAETVLVIIGHGGEAIAQTVGMPTLNLGYVSDDRQKAVCYSAADLFLFPTRAETFGNVALESMACGTPVVSFKVGGVPDLVQHGITGYLATPEDAQDFSKGIAQLLAEQSPSDMSQQCRAIASQEYSIELCAQRHLRLYNHILTNSSERLANEFAAK